MPAGEIVGRLLEAIKEINKEIHALEMLEERDPCDKARLCYLYEQLKNLERILNG